MTCLVVYIALAGHARFVGHVIVVGCVMFVTVHGHAVLQAQQVVR
jgi:hypothetical protein